MTIGPDDPYEGSSDEQRLIKKIFNQNESEIIELLQTIDREAEIKG